MILISALLSFHILASANVEMKLTQLGKWAGETTQGMQVRVVDDTTVFTAGATKGLGILNIKAPSAPMLQGFKSVAMGSSLALPWGSNRALLCNGVHGATYVIDVRDRTKPTIIDSITAGSVELAVQDSLIYAPIYSASGSSGGLGIYRKGIGDNSAVIRTGYLPLAGNIWDVSLQDTLAVVSAGTPGIHVVSVKDSSNPRLLSTIALSDDGSSFEAAWNGTQIWVVSTKGSVECFDLSNPAHPVSIAALKLGQGSGRRLTRHGKFLFVTSGAGLSVVDISTATAPTVVATKAASGWLSGVDVNDSLVFLMDETEGLSILRWKMVSKPILKTPLGNIYRQNTPVFAWHQDSAVSSFRFLVSQDSTFSKPSFMDLSTVTDTQFTMPLPMKTGKWWWKVVVDSVSSDLGRFTIISDSVPLPVFFNGDTVGKTAPTLRWLAAAKFDSASAYTVQLSTAASFAAPFSFATKDTFYALSLQLTNGTYYWRVLASKDTSPVDSFVIGTRAAGIESTVRRSGAGVRWNGALLSVNSSRDVAVYDLNGTLVAKATPVQGVASFDAGTGVFRKGRVYLVVGSQGCAPFVLP